MSEFLSAPHGAALLEIIRGFCKGEQPQSEIQQFEADCDALTQEEVSEVFDQLSHEGVYFQDNPLVQDYYHGTITEKLANGEIYKYTAGHPVRVYLEENRLLRNLFDQIHRVDLFMERAQFEAIFNQICTVELHYQRKENQLFPCLERHGWDSPSKNMWAFHDDIRAHLKQVRQALEQAELNKVAEAFPALEEEMQRLMAVEEQRLLPNAMQMLDESEWLTMRTGDEEIGWMLKEEPAPYPAKPLVDETNEEAYVHPSQVEGTGERPASSESGTHYDEGYMTPDQVNLIFRHLPLDITYVDENDRVVFYNRGEDRVFPRSAGIIGREVRYCHPPKSVDTVLRIVEAFRNGTKDVADFRINVRGRFILIRYFAVRDPDKTYRGVLEMSQDITDIKTLEGEQRLLDWD